MDTEKIFSAVFINDDNNEQKFKSFCKITPIGKRIIILVINLALGGNKAKKTIDWLIESKVICGTPFEIRKVQNLHETQFFVNLH